MCKSGKQGGECQEKTCPQCHGDKVIPGTCTCDMEWRGSQLEDEWSDCQCTPNETCPTCKGAGVVCQQ